MYEGPSGILSQIPFVGEFSQRKKLHYQHLDNEKMKTMTTKSGDSMRRIV